MAIKVRTLPRDLSRAKSRCNATLLVTPKNDVEQFVRFLTITGVEIASICTGGNT
jgi:hypothetical protein